MLRSSQTGALVTPPLLTIKDLVNQVGGAVTPRMIRHYHQIGLMPPPQRSQGNYRLYSQEDVQHLRRVVALKQQGFQLSHIKQLLEQDPTDSKTLMVQFHHQYQTVIHQIWRLRQTAQALEQLLSRDQACQSLQVHLSTQLQRLNAQTQEGLAGMDALWSTLDQVTIDHPEPFQESLHYLLPDLSHRSEIEVDLIQNLVLASGDVSIIPFLQIGPGAIAAARHHLQIRCSIVVDTSMVAAALDQARLAHLGCKISPLLNDPHVFTVSDAENAYWQSPQWKQDLLTQAHKAIVVIGYAPSVLIDLCELIYHDQCQPALVIGFPIGFNHAPAAKRRLMSIGVPYITVSGSLGGGLLAAVTLNALAASLLEKPNCHCYLQS